MLASRRSALLLLLPAGLAVGVRLLVGPLTVDDAYIIFRYARNIAEGTGYVYNSGQPVLGTTTPLYTLLLAGLAIPGLQDLPRVAWVLNALLDGATTALLFLVARQVAGQLAGVLAAWLFALAPMSIAYSAGGMETSLFVFTLTAGLWATASNRPLLAVAVVGLATLVRPEGALAAGLLFLGLTLRHWPIVLSPPPWRIGLPPPPWRGRVRVRVRGIGLQSLPLRALALYLAILAPWIAFATWQFGSPLPQSMAAKAVVYVVDPLANTAALLLHFLLPAQSLFLLGGPEPRPRVLAVLAVLLAPIVVTLAYAGARRLTAHQRILLPWVLFPISFALAYAVAGFRGVRAFHWYLIPLTPVYALFLAVGIPTVANVVATRFRIDERVLLRVASVLLALWWAPGLIGLGHFGYPVGFSTERERAYRELASSYSGSWGPGIVVAAPEIGTIGYHIRGEILDTVGLVSPAATAYYPLPRELLASDNAVAPRLIQDLQPHYVASLDQFVRLSLLPDPWFTANYEQLEAREVAVFDSRQLLVFRRKEG